jgi:hypothetical protein
MTWLNQYHQDIHVVEVTFAGSVTLEEILNASISTASLTKEKGSQRVLNDYLSVKGGYSISNQYEQMAIFESIKVDKRFKQAFLLPYQYGSELERRAFEAVCSRKGYQAKTFNDRDDALSWLDA